MEWLKPAESMEDWEHSVHHARTMLDARNACASPEPRNRSLHGTIDGGESGM